MRRPAAVSGRTLDRTGRHAPYALCPRRPGTGFCFPRIEAGQPTVCSETRIGSPLFHFGILVVLIGHIGGLVIPKSWT
jgi:hypothetical protein